MGQCLGVAGQVLQAVVAEDGKENSASNGNQQQSYASAAGGGGGWTTVSHGGSSGGGVSPVYSQLPSGAERVSVRNVYDGDTLTLVDQRRVRFLGIDTPEIKEKQPYSQEAKAYTKNLCSGDIWISHEPGQDKEDHYGRLLAFVWVKHDGGGYLCVNEGIVAAGYANAYIPNKNSKLHNWDKFLALQSEARNAKRGIWSTFQDFLVVKTANGSAYHKRSCEHLSNVRNLYEMKASEASAQGLHPCRTCLAD